MDILVLSLFCILLIISVIFKVSVIFALLGGFILFVIYGLIKGHSLKEMLSFGFSGVKSVANISIALLIIGSLTALWRASGTIPTIICYASKLIHPSVFILLTFLLCAAVSTLTGTSFGTAATIGVICASIANAMGISIFWTGGAILSGALYGDRCSPVSTSALLVSTITGTDIYKNIKNMYKSALIPTILAAIVFTVAGFSIRPSGEVMDVYGLFENTFVITPVALIPALAVLIMAFFKVKVRTMLLISDALAIIISLAVQKVPFISLIRFIVLGFSCGDQALAPIITGGGVISMVRVVLIVCIASSYSGIFEGTDILDSVKLLIKKVCEKTNPYTAYLLASIASSAVACNQSLAILLTNQLCKGLLADKERAALYIEDTAVIVAPMIPWSIAGTVALTAAGVPYICILASVFLYILPIYRCIISFLPGSKRKIPT